jgi:uncharacterized protein (TIGR03086 family)
MNAAELHARASDGFGSLVAAVRDDQWDDPTPDTEWDVRTLVRHLVYEQLWMPPLVTDGLTVPEVGDRFEGDILGGDPRSAWDDAAKGAVASVSEPGALERLVHLSGRDVSGERYAQEVFCDLTVHGWDLAVAIGADDAMDSVLLEAVWEIGRPMVDEWRGFGVFGELIPTPDDADKQTKLLAHYGRRRAWAPPL